MARPTRLRSLMAAAVPLLALLGCGGSRNDATAPAPAATPASSAPAAASGGAPPAGAQSPPGSPVPPGVDRTKPIATVNGRPIPAQTVYTVYQMNKRMLEQRGRELSETDDRALKAQSLEVVLADELMYQAAVAAGVKVGAAEVDTALKQFKTRVGSEENYKKFLASEGYTEVDVHREIERNLQTEAYRKALSAGKGVSEEQAKKFYDANKEMFKVPDQVHAQYILVKAAAKDPESVRADARKRAEEAARRAAAGEDFAALAKQFSQDQTAAKGGDVGFFPRGVMFPKFEEVAFSAKPGDISPVFETPKGFNVMKVLERKPESIRPFDEVRNALILDMGRLMEQDIVKGKVQKLAAAAKIVMLDPSFAAPAQPAPSATPAPTRKK